MRNPLNLLNQIHKGYSKHGPYYFKHLDFFDLEKIQEYYNSSFDKFVSQGIQTNQEKFDEAVERGEWSEEKDKEICLIPIKIKNLESSKSKLKFPQQQAKLDEDIDTFSNNLKDLVFTKNIIEFQSAEYYANKWSIQYQIYVSCFSDEQLTSPTWNSYDDFDESEEQIFNTLQEHYLKYYRDFSELNLKKVAINSFFRNIYSLGEPFRVFNKPLINLTVYQNQLLLYAKNFDLMFKHSNYIPNELLDDPEELEKWFVKNHNNKNQTQQPKAPPLKGLSSAIKEKGTLGLNEINRM